MGKNADVGDDRGSRDTASPFVPTMIKHNGNGVIMAPLSRRLFMPARFMAAN